MNRCVVTPISSHDCLAALTNESAVTQSCFIFSFTYAAELLCLHYNSGSVEPQSCNTLCFSVLTAKRYRMSINLLYRTPFLSLVIPSQRCVSDVVHYNTDPLPGCRASDVWVILREVNRICLTVFSYCLTIKPAEIITSCVFHLIGRFIYETEHFNGVAELLEILGRFVSTIRLRHFGANTLCSTSWPDTHTQSHTYISTHCTRPAVPIDKTAGSPSN